MIASSPAVEWTYSWKTAPGASAPKASVAPLKYGKRWAYTIEIDDSPRFVHEFGAELFARVHYTDAPAGTKGGKAYPVVGSVALWTMMIGANSTFLEEEDIRGLVARGWGMANHSYTHRGRTYGNPPEPLTLEEMRWELYWSQTVIASILGGRAPSHFVYPNGYTAYKEAVQEAGLYSGSLVSGNGGRNLMKESGDLFLIPRNYLDEGSWVNSGKSDPMWGFEKDPAEGDLVIDFTHGITPDSPNFERWVNRLEGIAKKYGKDGDSSFWSAPTQDIIHYRAAAKRAEVEVAAGALRVTLPEDAPGSALTIVLDGLGETDDLPVPEGGVVHRQGTRAWITTPMLGQPGLPPPQPYARKIWEGEPGECVLPTPSRLAGIRILRAGNPGTEFSMKAAYRTLDGAEHILAEKVLAPKWTGGYAVYSTVPGQDAPVVTSVSVTPHKIFKKMEVWVVAE
jgi:hypothetical protein